MQNKKTVYLYPFTKATLREGGNTYIPNLMHHLGRHFHIVNKQTSLGLVDVLLKMPKCDVIYFNWIEDVADKKAGGIQVVLLAFILFLSKLANIKVVWFVHNNLSHKKKNRWLKERVVALMNWGADVILSHSNEARIAGTTRKIQVFDHPMEAYQPIVSKKPFQYDLLIWGTVNPYKGVAEFLTFNQKALILKQQRILIAGKFVSPEYFEAIQQLTAPNVTIENRILSEDELRGLFSRSRYVLFTYNAASVLSSAALCKTLSHGKTIIGPDVGAFKELGTRGLIYTYTSFEDLERLLRQATPKENQPAFQSRLQEYIREHSWKHFATFIADAVEGRTRPLYAQAV